MTSAVLALVILHSSARSPFHAEVQREQGAPIVTLGLVGISVKRQQRPTVYVTGRRDTSANGVQVASAL